MFQFNAWTWELIMCPVDWLAWLGGGRFGSHSGPSIPRKPAPEALPNLGLQIVYWVTAVFDNNLSTDTETLGLIKGSKSGLANRNRETNTEFS